MATAQRPASRPAAVTHVAGLVLAAGAGSRYGGPRPSCGTGRRPHLGGAVGMPSRGIRGETIAVVVGAEADDVVTSCSPVRGRGSGRPGTGLGRHRRRGRLGGGWGHRCAPGSTRSPTPSPAGIRPARRPPLDLPDVTSGGASPRDPFHPIAHAGQVGRGTVARGIRRSAGAPGAHRTRPLGRRRHVGDRRPGARDYPGDQPAPFWSRCGDLLASGRDVDTPGSCAG